MPRTQVNSATGVMGVTGSGKSALGATLAEYVWRRWKKVTRYYNSDGGGFPASIQRLQALGIMEVFRMRTRDNPVQGGLSFETCYRACQGWWPKKIKPSTGEVPPEVEMIPPVALRFEQRCKNGHLVRVVPSQSMLVAGICNECRTPVTPADMQVSKSMVVNKGFEHVGAVIFDGLSSMLSWELMELGHRAGRLELRGEEAAIGGKVQSGDLKFGGTTRSHVGFAQTRGEELVHLALGIPNLVVPPVFTMLTHEDVDDRSLSITGPKIAGRAKTDEAPQWFGNLLECAKIPAREGTGEQRILYLSEFTDGFGRRHLCKNRAAPGTLPPELIDPPNTDLAENAHLAFSQFNLGLFFELLDSALEKAIEEGKAAYPDAPGMAEEWVEIGGGEAAPVAAPPVAAGPQTLHAPAPAAKAPVGKKKVAAPPAQPAVPAIPVSAAAAPAAPAQDVATAGEASTAPEPAPPADQAPAVSAAVAVPTPAPTPVPVPSTPAPAAAPAASTVPTPTPAPAPAPAAPRAAAPPAGKRPGTPPGATVSGPAMRPPAAAPRPPAATPRPRAAAPPTATPAPAPGTTTTQ